MDFEAKADEFMNLPELTGTSPTSANIRRGRSAQRAGQSWERTLEAAHRVLELQGVARIWKMPVPSRTDPRNPSRLIRMERAEPDHVGYLMGSGRAVLMEAKSNAKAVKHLIVVRDTKKRGLSDHQRAALYKAARAGVLSALVWKNGEQIGVIQGAKLQYMEDRVPWTAFRIIDRPEQWLAAAVEMEGA